MKTAGALRWPLVPIAAIGSCAGSSAAARLLNDLGARGLGASKLETLLPLDVRVGVAYGIGAALFVAIGAIVAPRWRVGVAVTLYAIGAYVAQLALSNWFFPEGHARAYQPSRIPLMMTLCGGLVGTLITVLRSARETQRAARQRRAAAFAILAAAALHGCGRAGDQSTRAARSDSDPVVIASRAADTQHVQGQGVPTPPDDTLGTQYGKHQGPARILAAPDCRPKGFALCLTDTAGTVLSYPAVADGGMPDMRVTEWLVFAAERDSMQIFISGGGESYLWMSPASAEGFEAEHAINDASWIRARFAHAGTYVYSAQIVSDAPVSYELRVAPVIDTGASWPTGESATLTIRARDSVAIAPSSLAPAIGADSAWVRFAVRPKAYRVLLVRDTMYIACGLPCRRPRRFTLRPSQNVTVSP